jgi:membrane protein implicated in regulation of membrane protease activity
MLQAVLANGVLDLGLDVDVWPWVWIGVAVVFALIELAFIGGTFVLLPFSVSAFVASLLAFYDVATEIQWVTFLAGGAIVLAVMLKWVRRFIEQNELPKGVGADRLVGETGVVTVAVDPDDTTRPGRVVIGGEVWGALSKDDEPLAVGTRVRVAQMIGTRVLVEALHRPAPDTTGDRTSDREDAT